MTIQFHRAVSAGHYCVDSLSTDVHNTHTEYVLSYIVRGQFTLLHKDLVTVEAGMFLLIPAGMPHTLMDGDQLEVCWMSFCPNCLELDESHPLMLPFTEVRQGALPILIAHPEKKSVYLQIHHALCDELDNQYADIEKEVLRSYLVLLLNELKKAVKPAGIQSHQGARVISAMNYIQQHFLTPISLQQVAEAVHISAPYLAALFKQETGFSVGQWIQQKRMTEACSRLLHTDQPISLIAEQIGISDTTHFIRQFKKTMGCTPAKWRKKHTNGVGFLKTDSRE